MIKKIMILAAISIAAVVPAYLAAQRTPTEILIRAVQNNSLTRQQLTVLTEQGANINYSFITRDMLRYAIEAAFVHESARVLELLLTHQPISLDPNLNSQGRCFPGYIARGFITCMTQEDMQTSQQLALCIFKLLLNHGVNFMRDTDDSAQYPRSILHELLDDLVESTNEYGIPLLQEAITALLVTSQRRGTLFSQEYILHELNYLRANNDVRMNEIIELVQDYSNALAYEELDLLNR